MLKNYIKNDLKNNRIASFIITCSVTIAVLLAVLSGILIIQLFGSMNQFMETAQTPHLLQMHSGEINRQDIEAFASHGKCFSTCLNTINLSIYEGEFVSVMDSYGSGKSTLMNWLIYDG